MTKRTLAIAFFWGILLLGFGESIASSESLQPSSITIQQQKNQSQNTLVLTRELWDSRQISLASLLNEYAGIQTKRFGGVGSYQELSIRGLGGNKVHIYLDDVLLNVSNGQALDLGKINLSQIAKIEVFKSFSNKIGDQSPGASIYLYSQEGSSDQIEWNSGVGSQTTLQSSLLYQKKISPHWLWHSTSAWIQAANDFEYFDRNRTPYNTEDDSWKKMQNAQYRQLAATQSLLWKKHNTQIKGFAHYQWSFGGIPGPEGNPTQTANFSSHQFSSGLHYQKQDPLWFLHKFDNLLTFSYSWEEYSWKKEDALTNFSTDDTRIANRNKKISNSLSLLWYPFPLWRLQTNHKVSLEQLTPFNLSDNDKIANNEWEHFRINTAHSLGNEFQISPKVSAIQKSYLSHNWDQTEKDSSFEKDFLWGSDIGLYYKSKVHNVSLALGRSFSAPSPREKFGGKKGQLANTQLKPEILHKAEISYHFFKKNTSTTISLFYNKMFDRIYFLQSGELSKPFNLSESESKGIELHNFYQPWKFISFDANYTYQIAQDLTKDQLYNNKQLPDEALWELNWKPSLHLNDWTLTYHQEWVGKTYRDRANTLEIHESSDIPKWIVWGPIPLPNKNKVLFHQEHHLQLDWKASLHHSFSLQVRNIADVYFENPYVSYPYPRRSIFLNYKLNL